MAEARDFHCYSHVVDNLGDRGPYRVTTSQYELSHKNRLHDVTKSNEFRVGCPDILPSAQF